MRLFILLVLLRLVTADENSLMMSTRFRFSNPLRPDLLDLYYDFMKSKSGPPEPALNVSGVSGNVKCSLLCALHNTSFQCTAFSYSPREKICSLFAISAFPTNRTELNVYKKIPSCPSNFVPYKDRCYLWKTGFRNFFDARRICNSINSHPVVIDDASGLEDLRAFITLPKEYVGTDYSPCKSRSVWTSGSLAQAGTLKFQWSPFEGLPSIPMTFFAWAGGEPSGGEYCVELYPGGWYNDRDCSIPNCVICEVDTK